MHEHRSCTSDFSLMWFPLILQVSVCWVELQTGSVLPLISKHVVALHGNFLVQYSASAPMC
uniref:Uncharacterized protein n=1 Tax=Anguilla anguilla TaxID=7936 RepID=A0A0E9XTN2_ANGAN